MKEPAWMPRLRTGSKSGVLRDVAQIGALALVYFTAGKLGLKLALFHQSASPVWPPTGIALAAVLLLGYRVWPGIWIGAFLVNATAAGSFLTSIGIATGNTLEAVVGAALTGRYANGRQAFEDPRDVLRFTFLAAMLSTMVSPTLGVTGLSLGGYARWSDYPLIWVTWWLGDLVGAVTITPLIVIWSTMPLPRWNRRRTAEALLMSALVAGAGLIVFAGVLPDRIHVAMRSFMAIPPLLWAAYRFGQRGAITAVLMLSGIALWGALRGVGPFVLSRPNDTLLLLQAFVWTITVTNLVLGAAVAEGQRVESALRHSQAELQAWHHELETRVQARTTDLAHAQQALRDEVSERKKLEALMARIVEREQLRLGSELHDGLGQRLTGISLLLAELQEKLEDPASDCAQDAQRLQRLVEQSIQETQSLARGFYPVEMEGFGLLISLKNLARATSRSFSVACEVHSDVPRQAEPRGPAAVQLYRIVQEALHNAVKHSRAKQIDIRLVSVDGDVTLTVTDDGVGLPPDQGRGQGMGLLIMRYRAQTIGGTLDVRTGPQGGVIVTCSVPAAEWSALLAAENPEA